MDDMKKETQGRPYIKETIRKKPINKRKVIWRIVITVVTAVLFGIIASLTFLIMEPIIGGVISPERVTKITFPEEEVPVEALLTEESKAKQEEADKQEVIDEARKEVAKELEMAAQSETFDEIGLEDYGRMYEQLSDLARSTQSFMVTVEVSTDATDWLAGSYEEKQAFSGVIVADNGLRLFVLADIRGREGDRYTIRFHDGTYVERPVQAVDRQTGLAIFAIPRVEVSQSTLSVISTAELGKSSNTDMLGRPVIAVGAPQGIADSVSYGTVTSNNAQLRVTDGIYQVMLTDISGSDQASGVFIDLNGNVVGVMAESAQSISSSGGIAAIGISEIKSLIAKLSNNEPRVYLGVVGMAVTSQAHDESQIPYGAYVTDVEVSSPAMQAGIRNGDIIVRIGDSSISSFKELRTVLFSMNPGEEQDVAIMRFDGQQYQEIVTQVILQEVSE